MSGAGVTHFRDLYGRWPDLGWHAPGRVNLVGEHTDYNDGFVLPIALPQGITVLIASRADGMLHVASRQRPGEHVRVSLDGLRPGQPGGWPAYAAGAAWALRDVGADVPGADLLVDGDVPLEAGLSSSAALTCASAAALGELSGLDLSPAALIDVARRSENDFVGVPTGVMDQSASVLCLPGHALFLDCRTREASHVPLHLARRGLALLVVDTKVPRRLLTSEYTARRATCERAALDLGVAALRDVTVDELDAALGRLRDEVARRRVRHVVTENARVHEVVALFRRRHLPRLLGQALNASHVSLRDDFEVTRGGPRG